ncbi:uncharacterized protein LOC132848053 [Tachysurus vachellii]|uniref:uncharacterized protein LOC132848053 n=1 Tax=Tachysurus vachellii TaxID=175792 RepID=UPI00296AFE95|nr:uncharacterized protein LOC132848053 [Tachysurus vachellii]
MQHLCLLLWGLFVSSYCGSSDSFSVTQFPSTLELKKGADLQISCSWNISIFRAKVKWFKDFHPVKFNQSDREPKGGVSTLVIKSSDENDAGFYTCEVTQDVPQLLKRNGTGTYVTYQTEDELVTTIRPVSTASPSTPEPVTATTKPVSVASTRTPHTFYRGPAKEVNENGPIIFAIRCVPFITLLLAVCFLNSYKTNKPPKRSAGKQALVVEENEQNGQEHREQDRKEEKRNKQLGPERGAETEKELTAEEREVNERTETEQGREVEVVNEITGKKET